MNAYVNGWVLLGTLLVLAVVGHFLLPALHIQLPIGGITSP